MPNAVGKFHILAAEFPEGIPMGHSADIEAITAQSAVGTLHIAGLRTLFP